MPKASARDGVAFKAPEPNALADNLLRFSAELSTHKLPKCAKIDQNAPKLTTFKRV
jgi:hypothetical protein